MGHYKINFPKFILYDGMNDPNDHILHYNQATTLYDHDKALLCRMFPSSLGPLALKWFNRLEDGSIWSFKELQRTFVSRFASSKKSKKEMERLLILK